MSGTTDAVIMTKSAEEGITTIVINRHERRNAVDPRTALQLYEAFLAFEADSTQEVCVFHGVGGTFCAGADLIEASSRKTNDTGADDGGQVNNLQPVSDRNIAPKGPSRLQVSKPVICAVQGYAVAGGLELSLIADLRVVEEDAVFGVFCRRWGVPLIDGGTVRLPAIIGLGRAMDMILTGRAVDAREALSFGLANRVVKKGTAVNEAMRLARELRRFPQLCMNADRRSAYHAAYEGKSFEHAMGYEYDNGVGVVREEGLKGAGKFRDGLGRHGNFGKI